MLKAVEPSPADLSEAKAISFRLRANWDSWLTSWVNTERRLSRSVSSDSNHEKLFHFVHHMAATSDPRCTAEGTTLGAYSLDVNHWDGQKVPSAKPGEGLSTAKGTFFLLLRDLRIFP